MKVKFIFLQSVLYGILLSGLIVGCSVQKQEKTVAETVDSLPSWRAGAAKVRLLNFVRQVTDTASTSYLPPRERIAVFDNDGTLWSEKPIYFQVEFVLHRIKQLAPKHPEWKEDELIRAALDHDLKTLREKFGVGGLGRLMALTQSGMSAEAFEDIVREWIQIGRHPLTGRLFKEMVFQPMLELIRYLQDNDFQVYIVSGGGIDFMRAWIPEVYGIPRNHIIGSMPKYRYEKINGKPVLIKLAEILFVNNQEGKPMSIHRVIGRKPVLAFGNSDGDLQMLEWCAASPYKNLAAIIHHTDKEREWAYDRKSNVGRLDEALKEAEKQGWLVVDMKKDWASIFPLQR